MGRAIEALAHFVAGTPWDAIPPVVRECAQLVVLDTVGVILAGSVQPEVASRGSLVRPDRCFSGVPDLTREIEPSPSERRWHTRGASQEDHADEHDGRVPG